MKLKISLETWSYSLKQRSSQAPLFNHDFHEYKNTNSFQNKPWYGLFHTITGLQHWNKFVSCLENSY